MEGNARFAATAMMATVRVKRMIPKDGRLLRHYATETMPSCAGFLATYPMIAQSDKTAGNGTPGEWISYSYS